MVANCSKEEKFYKVFVNEEKKFSDKFGEKKFSRY
jgi:hypothetical protein